MLSSLAEAVAVIAVRAGAMTVSAVLAGRNELIRTAMATLRRYPAGGSGQDTDAPAPAFRLTLNQRHPADSGSADAACAGRIVGAPQWRPPGQRERS
jgi:hypothetical protein